MRLLLALACACSWAAPALAQSPASDPVTPLLQRLEQALTNSDGAALAELFSPDVTPTEIDLFLSHLQMPGAVKTTLRERDRSPLEGAPPGDGFSLVVEFFVETPGRARILTTALDMRRPPNGDLASWRLAGAESLTFVEGLYKLRLDPRPQAARDLQNGIEVLQPGGAIDPAEQQEVGILDPTDDLERQGVDDRAVVIARP